MHRSEPVVPNADDHAVPRRGPHDMLADVVDLYLRAPTHDKGEIRAFAALVDGLLDAAVTPARRRVSIALSKRPDTPPEIARRLAMDSIEVAEPMIVESPVLTSSDLVEIMRRGPEHVRCVTRRLDLAPDIAAVLVDSTVTGPTRPVIVPAKRRRDEIAAAPAATSSPLSARAPAPVTDALDGADAVEPTPAPAVEARVRLTPPPLFDVPVRPMPKTTETSPTVPALDRSPERLERAETTSASRKGHAFVAMTSAGRWRALQSAALETATRTGPARGGVREPGLLGDRLLRAATAEDASVLAEALTEALGLERGLVDAILAEPSGEALAVVLVACGIGEIRATSVLLHHLGPAATLGMLQDLAALVERTPRRVAEHLVLSWREDRLARRAGALRQSDAAERREAAGTPREAGTGETRIGATDGASRRA
ncbi:DUF2336 domain-containing protein [Pinisolibacter aquiterrae]|uniref:DUF2336 domain-containing protein n=1 Tax=Pinisolibacter aquiterrae TaxID=2815579 RepID=UPI001C3DA64E|nr:DUF2336 domain-containing protein [Pinisolibacter aquiterrae]MBV5263188.1 DUF2336 domain-containing protein [Pinisolibacter aquiterrae]MCC8234102.1 DUF2336 domain-containing protein [Pinisolibacter aquiterrae]